MFGSQPPFFTRWLAVEANTSGIEVQRSGAPE
jgi:hypothetical protein